MARDISWNELFDLMIDKRLRSVHTSMVGTIRSYSEAQQTATVELATELEGPGGEFLRAPNLEGVPVTQPGAWSNGDRCLLVFTEEDASKWWATGSVEPPVTLIRHGLHAVCVPLVEGASDFVALKALVETALVDLLDGVISAAGSVTAPGGGPAFVSALNLFKASYELTLQVGAAKVKAV